MKILLWTKIYVLYRRNYVKNGCIIAGFYCSIFCRALNAVGPKLIFAPLLVTSSNRLLAESVVGKEEKHAALQIPLGFHLFQHAADRCVGRARAV